MQRRKMLGNSANDPQLAENPLFYVDGIYPDSVDIATGTTNEVQRWNDLSGNDIYFNAYNNSYKPLYDGEKWMSYTTYGMAGRRLVPNLTAWTFFMHFKIGSNRVTAQLLYATGWSKHHGNNNTQIHVPWLGVASNNLRFYQIPHAVSISVNTEYLAVIRYDGTKYELYLNGELIRTTYPTYWYEGLLHHAIGSRSHNGRDHFMGNIGLALMYNRGLDDVEFDSTHNFLLQRTGIV